MFLIAVCIVVAATAAGALPSGAVGWGLVAAAIAALGLPHGALDTRVAQAAFGIATVRRLALFLGAYVALAVLVAGLFVVAPVVALVGFLAIAAVHFGEDLASHPRAILPGLAIVALPAVRFEAEVAAIFSAMTGGGAVVAAAMAVIAPLALGGTVLAVRRPDALLVLGAYTVLALTVPPHIAFAVYFCAFHSPRHFREVSAELGLTTSEAIGAAAPYALAAGLAGAVAAVVLAAGADTSNALARAVFVGLACLTVPHMALEYAVRSHRLPLVGGRAKRLSPSR